MNELFYAVCGEMSKCPKAGIIRYLKIKAIMKQKRKIAKKLDHSFTSWM
jgi:hypothetical protein